MPRSVSHAFITGASSGIGLALARQLAERGAALTLVARNGENLAAAVQSLPHPERIFSTPADVTDPTSLADAFARGMEIHGSYGLVVANAGQAEPGVFTDLAGDVFRQLMEVNYHGCVHTARLAIPHFLQGQGGSLIFVASGAALTGLAGYSAYSPTKFAVRGLAECLRNEYAPRGLHIGLVYPPDTETPQLVYEESRKPAFTKAITSRGGRVSPEVVARAILRGYDRRKFLIAPGLAMKLLARWHSLINPLLWWYFDGLVKRHSPAKNHPETPHQ